MKLRFPSRYILILCLLSSSYSTEGLVLPFLSIHVLLAWAWFSYFSLDNAFLLCVSSSILMFTGQLISPIYSLLQLQGNILQYTVFGYILIFKRTNFVRWFHNIFAMKCYIDTFHWPFVFCSAYFMVSILTGVVFFFLIILSMNFFFY